MKSLFLNRNGTTSIKDLFSSSSSQLESFSLFSSTDASGNPVDASGNPVDASGNGFFGNSFPSFPSFSSSTTDASGNANNTQSC